MKKPCVFKTSKGLGLIASWLLLSIVVLSHVFPPHSLAKPPQILIRNAALVLTMDPSLGVGPLGILENSDVLLSGNSIASVGHNLRGTGDTIDATGKIVMPGFVDVHDHLWQTLIRGCGTDQDLVGWLNTCTYPLAKFPFTQSEIAAAVRLSTMDLISTGVTTVVDWSPAWTSAFAQGNVQGLLESGLRFSFAYLGSTKSETVQAITRLKKDAIDRHSRATLQIAAHPSVGEPMLSRLIASSKLADTLGVFLHVHLLEHQSDRKEQPLTALAQAGALNADLLAAHVVHPTSEEIALLASKGVRVAHNPLSNMRLASGIMPLPAMQAAGVPVGLGLDGGTNDTMDMFNNMRAAVGLQRVSSLRADVYPTVVDVLRLATIEGAKVLKMERQIGSLSPGKKADLIILDPQTVNFAPRVDWISQIVFNGQPRNVEWVFVDGRPLKAEGKLIGANPDSLFPTVQKTAKKVKQFLQARRPSE